MIKIVIADDDKNLRKVLLNELSDEGFEVLETDQGSKTIELLEHNEYDVLLLDMNMPGLSGLDVLKKIKDLEIPTEIIILTAYATVSTAVEAMKIGAYDYLTKPFRMEELITVIEKAYEKKQLLRENLLLKTQIKRQTDTKSIITANPVMLGILEDVKKFAVSGLPVLVCGESGVGKELIAKRLHDMSDRSEGPFLPINCGAIPETMLESELFGHEKGAFTGAYAKKMGLLEIANHGTLFLDEISELSQRLQGKLLRVIETGKFFKVGGTREIGVDVRFVSATNKDVKKDVATGDFRPDLYYRIGAVNLYIPPLRERKEDIPLLVEHIIQSSPQFRNKKLSKKAMEMLVQYGWPGNIRELQNVIRRALFLSNDTVIGPQDLSPDLATGHAVSSRKLEDIEKEHILKIYREANGQKRRAAEILGVDPKTLYRKLHSYGIEEQ
jgi:DNA-binding NtrC family response regulator